MRAIKTISFITIICLLFIAANTAYVRSDHYQAIGRLYRFENVPDTLQLVNVGSSHGEYGIDYQGYPQYRAANFACASQTLLGDYYILQSYQEKLREDCVVFIPISYFSLYGFFETIFPEQKARYYRILDWERVRNLPGFSVDDLLNYRIFPVLSAKTDVLETIGSHSASIDFPPRPEDVGTVPDDRKSLGMRRAQGHINNSPEQISPDAIEGLQGMLRLCEENGWQAVLLMTPTHQYYADNIPTTFRSIFLEQLRVAIADFPEVPFWDYTRSAPFYSSLDYFVDTDHLNTEGRRVFSDMLIKRCIAQGLLGA